MKIVLQKVPPSETKLKAGQVIDATGAAMDTMLETGYEFVTKAEHDSLEAANRIKARAKTEGEAQITKACERAVKRKALLPQGDAENSLPTVKAKYLTRFEAGNDVDLLVEVIDALKGDNDGLTEREIKAGEGDLGVEELEPGLRATIKGYLKAAEPDFKWNRENGGMIRARRMDAKGLEEGMVLARRKSALAGRLASMIRAGADFTVAEGVVKAADYADAAGALGTLNSGIVLTWNLGHLENQLAMIGDITTDISNTPVLFQQQALTRYIKVPGVQLKTNSNAWSGGTGNDVNVNVLMDQYAGVPLTINNYLLGTTMRQLVNEQKTPQLYGLGEYILYKLINNIINGNTRIANDGVTTATIKFAPTGQPANAITFNVAGATLKTFVSDLPAAMDLAKFPGGDEPPGASDLQRFVWAHTSLYSSIAGDTNFQLNQSIQGIAQNKGENMIMTGRFHQIGNARFNKSQLMTDQNTTSGSGADGGANALTVVPGAYAAATVVGFSGTRSALLFVSRAPLDYTKVMPEVPNTAAIELVTSPGLGITFMVVKYLDHGYENANMRVQCMFGTGIGDERQGMPLVQK